MFTPACRAMCSLHTSSGITPRLSSRHVPPGATVVSLRRFPGIKQGQPDVNHDACHESPPQQLTASADRSGVAIDKWNRRAEKALKTAGVQNYFYNTEPNATRHIPNM